MPIKLQGHRVPASNLFNVPSRSIRQNFYHCHASSEHPWESSKKGTSSGSKPLNMHLKSYAFRYGRLLSVALFAIFCHATYVAAFRIPRLDSISSSEEQALSSQVDQDFLPKNAKSTANPPSEVGLVPRQVRHWTLENVTRLENSTDEATIAYFIQVSDGSLPLLPRLLSRLHHPGNFYAVHFDKKIASYRVVPIVQAIRRNPSYKNVHLMAREPVTYRGITMVLNNLAAMSDLMALGQWDYFINLSGSDYPLVSPTLLRRLLGMPYIRERASNFFTISPREQWDVSKRFRFEKVAVDLALGLSQDIDDSKLIVLDQKTPLFNKLRYSFVKGEGWVIVTRAACDFMSRSSYARKMLMSMAFSQDASEHFYISLFWNHPELNRTVVQHSLRTVYWRLNGVDSGQHPYTLDQMRGKDGTYTIWEYLRRSPHFFARKFSVPEGEIFDLIDNQMSGLGKNVNQTAVQEATWRVESHLHWLLGFLPISTNHEAEKGIWPGR